MHQYQGNHVSHVVDVNDHRDSPLTVLSVSCAAEFVNVELIPVDSTDVSARWNGLVGQFRVSAARVPPGAHDCVVRIQTDDPEFSELELPMHISGPLIEATANPLPNVRID